MSRFVFSSRALAGALLLALSGGVQADPAATPSGLFDVYQSNRETGRPNLITPDLLLVSYGLIRQHQNTSVEFQMIIPEFKALAAGLQAALASSAEGETEALARDYVTLLQAMLTGVLPEKASEVLSGEWRQVQQAGGLAESPLWGITLDYSQFKPRGRYTQSEDMRRYFVAYRYAGTVNFFVVPSKATGVDEAKARQLSQVAIYLSRVIAKDVKLLGHYDAIQSALTWEYGQAGDMGVKEVEAATRGLADGTPKGEVLLAYARKQGRLPQIIDLPVDVSKLGKDEKIAEVALGWRLLPGAQSADGVAVQTVLYPNTRTFNSPCGTIQCVRPWTESMIEGKQAKGYVSAYEIMAWQGSVQAQSQVKHRGDNLFDGYAAAVEKAKSALQSDRGLSGAQGAFMREVFAEAPDPGGRQLTGMLGFWTWQQSINALYTKQVMTPASKSLSMNPPAQRKGAVLLGTPGFYAALTKLSKQNAEHAALAKFDPAWTKFAEITQHLANMAKVKSTAPSNDADDTYLNELDTALLALTHGKDRPIVVDVQTNPLDKLVVEEALGNPDIQELNKARGAWFRHYEFKQDMGARLTHEEWRKALGNP
jgi:hypothetical protein